MAKQLTLDEMIESLTLMNHPAAGACQAVIEAIGTLMADTIAADLGVSAGPATFEGTAFAGTCAPFRPAYPGQPCPSPLSDYDPEEWIMTLTPPLHLPPDHQRFPLYDRDNHPQALL